jgi:hypothetical protein
LARERVRKHDEEQREYWAKRHQAFMASMKTNEEKS